MDEAPFGAALDVSEPLRDGHEGALDLVVQVGLGNAASTKNSRDDDAILVDERSEALRAIGDRLRAARWLRGTRTVDLRGEGDRVTTRSPTASAAPLSWCLAASSGRRHRSHRYRDSR